MKAATVKEIKTELENLSPAALLPLTLRLAKFKKENKELLTYLQQPISIILKVWNGK